MTWQVCVRSKGNSDKKKGNTTDDYTTVSDEKKAGAHEQHEQLRSIFVVTLTSSDAVWNRRKRLKTGMFKKKGLDDNGLCCEQDSEVRLPRLGRDKTAMA